MANQSIYNAFQRFWQHVLAVISDRVGDIEAQKTQVQIVRWEDGDEVQ